MKRILIASDSFKGTLSSLDICDIFSNILEKHKDISATYLPLADGGEGSLECVSKVLEGRFIDIDVKGLYFDDIKSHYYIDKDNNAYIEAASVVGLTLAKEDNNPGLVTTYGMGEQILDAINKGCKNIYVFIGGSASNDGGVGLASALGTKFYNKDNKEFIPVGLTLKDIVRIDNKDTLNLLKGINLTVLSDVKSPLYGIDGAAFKFAKQKGAKEEELPLLDDGLKHLNEIVKKDLKIDMNVVGSGAAGGLGGGLYAFLDAKIISGIDKVLDIIDFDNKVKDVDLVITGEGKLDRQTFEGKVIAGVSSRCHKDIALIVGISEVSIDEVNIYYPNIKYIIETNDKHLPFNMVKDNAKEDYIKAVNKLLTNLED